MPIMTRIDTFSSRLPARSLSPGVARSSPIPSDLARSAPRMRKRCSMQPNPSLVATTGSRTFPPAAAAWATSGLGLFTRYPLPGILPWRRQDLPSSWGIPMVRLHVFLPTPAGLLAPDHYGAAAWPLDPQVQRLPRKVFRRPIAWLSDSLSTLRRADYSDPTQDSLPAAGQALPDGLSTHKIPLRGFKIVSLHLYPPLPSFACAMGVTEAGQGKGGDGISPSVDLKKTISKVIDQRPSARLTAPTPLDVLDERPFVPRFLERIRGKARTGGASGWSKAAGFAVFLSPPCDAASGSPAGRGRWWREGRRAEGLGAVRVKT